MQQHKEQPPSTSRYRDNEKSKRPKPVSSSRTSLPPPASLYCMLILFCYGIITNGILISATPTTTPTPIKKVASSSSSPNTDNNLFLRASSSTNNNNATTTTTTNVTTPTASEESSNIALNPAFKLRFSPNPSKLFQESTLWVILYVVEGFVSSYLENEHVILSDRFIDIHMIVSSQNYMEEEYSFTEITFSAMLVLYSMEEEFKVVSETMEKIIKGFVQEAFMGEGAMTNLLELLKETGNVELEAVTFVSLCPSTGGVSEGRSVGDSEGEEEAILFKVLNIRQEDSWIMNNIIYIMCGGISVLIIGITCGYYHMQRPDSTFQQAVASPSKNSSRSVSLSLADKSRKQKNHGGGSTGSRGSSGTRNTSLGSSPPRIIRSKSSFLSSPSMNNSRTKRQQREVNSFSSSITNDERGGLMSITEEDEYEEELFNENLIHNKIQKERNVDDKGLLTMDILKPFEQPPTAALVPDEIVFLSKIRTMSLEMQKIKDDDWVDEENESAISTLSEDEPPKQRKKAFPVPIDPKSETDYSRDFDLFQCVMPPPSFDEDIASVEEDDDDDKKREPWRCLQPDPPSAAPTKRSWGMEQILIHAPPTDAIGIFIENDSPGKKPCRVTDVRRDSSIRDQIRGGDWILKVDEFDVSRKSAMEVSKILTQSALNPEGLYMTIQRITKRRRTPIPSTESNP